MKQQPSNSGIAAYSAKAAVVRYQVKDVARSVAFYNRLLGFQVEQDTAPVIGIVSRGDLHLILGGPNSSGARPMPDGRRQEAGGWNRIVLYVDSIDTMIASLAPAKVRFRNAVESGPAGKQILVEDPDGNPVEIHEAPRPDR